MLIKQKINDFLFLDIETVSQYATYDDLVKANSKMAEIFTKKALKFKSEYPSEISESEHNLSCQVYKDKAGLYPEFGKIIAIGVGMFLKDADGNLTKEYIKVSNSHDEKQLLNDFLGVIGKIKTNFVIFGHNVIGFDIPYLCKRLVYNGIAVPDKINFSDKKPWEINIVDSMSLSRFGGGFDMNISLDLLCLSCGIDSPKTYELNGKYVNNIYYENDKPSDSGLELIVGYNKKDIKACMDIAKYFVSLYNINNQ